MSKTMVNVIMLFISIGLAVGGQLTMKVGMNRVGEITAERLENPVELIGDVIKSVWAIVGIFLYAVSSVFWLVVLSRVPISVAYPIVAIGYVFVVFFSRFVFHEEVKLIAWIGLVLIVLGVSLTALGLESDTDGDDTSLKAPVHAQLVEHEITGVKPE